VLGTCKPDLFSDAAQACADAGRTDLREPLQARLRDGDPAIRRAASQALTALGVAGGGGLASSEPTTEEGGLAVATDRGELAVAPSKQD